VLPIRVVRIVLKVADFRQRADECRRLAAKASHPQSRDDLIKIAAAWSELADGRARKVGESQSVARSVELSGSPDLGSPGLDSPGLDSPGLGSPDLGSPESAESARGRA
jgi:hypothetical protein